MTSLFHNASSFNQYIGNWNISNVANMTSMFQGAISFNQDISGWDVTSVSTMESMFEDAAIFSIDITKWRVSSLTNLARMFVNARLFNRNISYWQLTALSNRMYTCLYGTCGLLPTFENMLLGSGLEPNNFGLSGVVCVIGSSIPSIIYEHVLSLSFKTCYKL